MLNIVCQENEDGFDSTIQGLEEYTKKGKERLVILTSYSNINRSNLGETVKQQQKSL